MILENAISMTKILPETDCGFAEKMLQRREGEFDDMVGGRLKPMTGEDFLRDAEIAEKQFKNGEYQEMGAAIDEICQELGI